MSDCPFRLCDSNVVVVIEQLTPDDDELTRIVIPMHPIGGHEGFGTCPASLQSMPVSAIVQYALDEQATIIERILAEREAMRPAERAQPPPDESRTKSPYWFTPTGSGSAHHAPRYIPPLPRQLMPQVLLPEGPAQPMSSVPEVRAALAVVKTLIAQADSAVLQAVGGQLQHAKAEIDRLREGSQTLQVPQVGAALDLVGDIHALCNGAIEEISQYEGNL